MSVTKPSSDTLEWQMEFQGRQHLMATIGRRSYIVGADYDYGSLRSHILIGRYTSIAHDVAFEVGMNHHYREVATYPFQDFELQRAGFDGDASHAYDHNHYQIIIGNDVWIGCHTILLGGVQIGNGAIIGAGAVVAKNVPPYAVVVGNPARVVKYRFPKDIIEKLQRIKWWYWDEETIEARRAEMKSPEDFVARYDVPPFVPGAMPAFLAEAHDAGRTVYSLLYDADERKPVWENVLKAYLETFRAASSVLLVLEVPAGFRETEGAAAVQHLVQTHGGDAPTIVLHETAGIPAVDVLPHADIFIAGCSEASSYCVDFAADWGVKVRSGCDDGAQMF